MLRDFPHPLFHCQGIAHSVLPRKAPFSLLASLLVKSSQRHAQCDTQTPLQWTHTDGQWQQIGTTCSVS